MTPTQAPMPSTRGPTEPGDTAWFELTLYASGVTTATGGDPTGDAASGHLFRAGTLDAGQTVRLELPDDHAFADGPRAGLILVGSDDGATSDVKLVDAGSGEASSVLSAAEIVSGATLSPDGAAIYYVPVHRTSMRDLGLWRLDLEEDGDPEQVIGEFAEATYDFASQIYFSWSPDGQRFVGQYCNRGDCQAHIVDPATNESVLHDQPGVFELRGATDDAYVADAFNGERSGILAVDLTTLDVRTLSGEWGASEVHQTAQGPVVVYFVPNRAPREMLLVGIWLDREASPFPVYEDRTTDTPPTQDFHPLGTGYEAPEGWLLLWPGSPGPDPDPSWEPTFMLIEVLTGEERTFAHPGPG